jgi:hypothetical protein
MRVIAHDVTLVRALCNSVRGHAGIALVNIDVANGAVDARIAGAAPAVAVSASTVLCSAALIHAESCGRFTHETPICSIITGALLQEPLLGACAGVTPANG